MFPHSSGHRPSQWYSPPSEQAFPHSSSSQWSYPVHQEDSPMKASGQHPSLPQSNPGHPDNSFRRTLLEIEDTYYRTFPAAAEAHGYRWRMGSGGKEHTEEPNIGFFSHTSGMSGMTAGTYASDYGVLGKGIWRRRQSDGQFYRSDGVVHPRRSIPAAFPSPCARPPIGAMGHGQYLSPNIVQAESSIAGALRASNSIASSLSPSYGPTPASGSLSDATRAQDAWKGAQDSFSSSYVTSNPAGTEDARVPPMVSRPGRLTTFLPSLFHLEKLQAVDPTKRKRGKDSDKKPPLACLFCRGRKIACGPPPPDGDGKTCNQCHRRSLKCEYPAESRRGMRKEKLPNLNTGGAKVVVKNKKR
ncbi:hypothetical protein FA13DRAFT_1785978 [Coprinellus micaceus]|uniref:Zn(2)-C6 fungal-type domain-containing protein n=1 Tax=Coprinellus micaceus TaxID=71717 RepID=A0A4Y7TX15_COPMI|nr:hypothetical protein FA13DRAFT_1785978 [Coprinellus micaceus]